MESRLEELKRKSEALSMQHQQVDDELEAEQAQDRALARREEELDQQMVDLMRNAISTNLATEAAEREKLNNRLEAISEYQRATTDQLTTLNNNLTNTTSLEAVYKAKRKELESNYQELETSLRSRENALKSQIQDKEAELQTLEQAIEAQKQALEALKWRETFRKAMDKAISALGVTAVVIVALFIGQKLFGLLSWLWSGIVWLWNGISGAFTN